ncbi:MAG: SPOR domain-containing protein [Oscillatoriales cyanobacterium]|nr:MAG: SPOR domain-containing protein [Oscillatoriales cyanobacterium]
MALATTLAAPMARAEETIPFGQPLPGRPSAPEPDPAAESSSDRSTPPVGVEVLSAPNPPSVPESDAGWIVDEGAGPAVTVVPEAAPAASAQPPTPPIAAAQPAAEGNFFEPVMPNQGGRYAVYALGDNLGLFEQVQRLSPSAAFVTYRGQTAVRAGLFERAIDAQARVRELAQRGIPAEVGENSSTAASPVPASPMLGSMLGSMTPIAVRPGQPDPSTLFDDFAAGSPGPRATGRDAPLPMAGRRLPPIGNTNRGRSLPEPPPESAIESPAPRPLAVRSPLPTAPSPIAAAAAAAANPEGYFVVVTSDRAALPQLINQLGDLGLPASSLFPSENGGLQIGPFADVSTAQQWRSRLQTAQLQVELMHNGWVMEDSQP